ncbi:hypothetical protein MRX96_028554 [Rhipicephalus microplus]
MPRPSYDAGHAKFHTFPPGHAFKEPQSASQQLPVVVVIAVKEERRTTKGDCADLPVVPTSSKKRLYSPTRSVTRLRLAPVRRVLSVMSVPHRALASSAGLEPTPPSQAGRQAQLPPLFFLRTYTFAPPVRCARVPRLFSIVTREEEDNQCRATQGLVLCAVPLSHRLSSRPALRLS